MSSDPLLDPDLPGIAARRKELQALQTRWDTVVRRVLLRSFLLKYPGTRALTSLLGPSHEPRRNVPLHPAELRALRQELFGDVGVWWAREAWSALLSAAVSLAPGSPMDLASSPSAFFVARHVVLEHLLNAETFYRSAPEPFDVDGCPALRVIEPVHGAVFVGYVRQRAETDPAYVVLLDPVESTPCLRYFDRQGAQIQYDHEGRRLPVVPGAGYRLVLGDLAADAAV